MRSCPRTRCPPLTHCLYADDVMLFELAEQREAGELARTMNPIILPNVRGGLRGINCVCYFTLNPITNWFEKVAQGH
jgi:hypothetical protein